jgi:cell division protein FtsL
MARAAGTATARKPARTRTAARPPARRRSGPARGPKQSAGTGAARAKPAAARSTAVAAPAPRRAPRRLRVVAAVCARQVSRERASALLDRLLRGRGWVVCVGMLLAGIVFLNVSLLELNSGITRTNGRAVTLKRENALLRQEVASLGSSERIQTLAAERGMVLPAPGDVHYVRANTAVDAWRAVRQLRAAAPPAPPPVGIQPVAPAPAAPAPTAGPPAGATAPEPPAPAPQPAPAAPQPAPAAPAPAAQG